METWRLQRHILIKDKEIAMAGKDIVTTIGRDMEIGASTRAVVYNDLVRATTQARAEDCQVTACVDQRVGGRCPCV